MLLLLLFVVAEILSLIPEDGNIDISCDLSSSFSLCFSLLDFLLKGILQFVQRLRISMRRFTFSLRNTDVGISLLSPHKQRKWNRSQGNEQQPKTIGDLINTRQKRLIDICMPLPNNRSFRNNKTASQNKFLVAEFALLKRRNGTDEMREMRSALLHGGDLKGKYITYFSFPQVPDRGFLLLYSCWFHWRSFSCLRNLIHSSQKIH